MLCLKASVFPASYNNDSSDIIEDIEGFRGQTCSVLVPNPYSLLPRDFSHPNNASPLFIGNPENSKMKRCLLSNPGGEN